MAQKAERALPASQAFVSDYVSSQTQQLMFCRRKKSGQKPYEAVTAAAHTE